MEFGPRCLLYSHHSTTSTLNIQHQVKFLVKQHVLERVGLLLVDAAAASAHHQDLLADLLEVGGDVVAARILRFRVAVQRLARLAPDLLERTVDNGNHVYHSVVENRCYVWVLVLVALKQVASQVDGNLATYRLRGKQVAKDCYVELGFF